MIIKTIFNHGGAWETGEVEIYLLQGIPNLHVVGLPDAQIRESGIKLKSALKASGFKWPRGHQIIVNLRPNHFRKSSAGVELAVALGVLRATGQLSADVEAASGRAHVYGEVALDGRVIAPPDLPFALRAAGGEVLTGVVGGTLREGEWSELAFLKDQEVSRRARFFDWDEFFKAPGLEELSLHPKASRALALAAHMNLHVLLAGPQGSGKSTWARLLYGLSERPDVGLWCERESWLGVEPELRWRPFEQPHHSITPLAMIGGSAPIQPGVVSRAHGGMLVMDEFLEFHSQVLENLREPVESGKVEIARKGARERLPARFQLVGTTNLCRCGKLYPGRSERCSHAIAVCGGVVRRLSGPLLDRFDMLLFSHEWLERGGGRVVTTDVAREVAAMRAFRAERGEVRVELPEWVHDLALSHRRNNSLLRVARGIADQERSVAVESRHFAAACQLVVDPIQELNQMFA